jgi:hypothetical protein
LRWEWIGYISFFPPPPLTGGEGVRLFVGNSPSGPGSVKKFYFLLIIDSEKPPWVLTRYRYNQNLIKGLPNPCLFKPPVDVSRLLSKGIGLLSWSQLRKILEVTRDQFRTQAEKRFVDDLIVYLDYKIKEGDRIRTERKQLSFW